MADRTEFKHIKVNANDDDTIIVAGAPAYEDKRKSSNDAIEVARSGVSSRPAEAAAAQVEQKSTGKDAFSPTTLQDIEQSKIPAAQKIVIALAVLAIIAFVVWYWLDSSQILA